MGGINIFEKPCCREIRAMRGHVYTYYCIQFFISADTETESDTDIELVVVFKVGDKNTFYKKKLN